MKNKWHPGGRYGRLTWHFLMIPETAHLGAPEGQGQTAGLVQTALPPDVGHVPCTPREAEEVGREGGKRRRLRGRHTFHAAHQMECGLLLDPKRGASCAF